MSAEPESAFRRSLIQIYNEGINDPQSAAVTDFARVTDSQAQEIRDLTGVDVAGFKHSLRATRVRKILRSHGQPQEELRGQRPVTREDILRIPEVVKNGTISALQEHPHSKRPEKAIQFRLRDSGDVIVVEETQNRARRMDVVSMWIEKGGRGDSSTPGVPPNPGAPAHTSAPDSAPFRASPTPGSTDSDVEVDPDVPTVAEARYPNPDYLQARTGVTPAVPAVPKEALAHTSETTGVDVSDK